jgi:glycosyltransferase involved in cell wall biosynthesis
VRIAVLSPTFLPAVGGAELVLYEVYRRLARRHDVRMLTPALGAALLRQYGSEEYQDAPFPVERYDDRRSFMKLRGHRLSAGAIPPFSLSAVTALRDLVRRVRPEVVNVHYVMPTGLAALVADRGLGVPAVVTVNGRDVPGPGVPRLWRRWQRLVLRRVSGVTYVSAFCRDALFDGDAPGEVVYNGVAIPAAAGDGGAVRRRLEIDEREPVIFALQRLAPEKRVDVVVRALRHCRERLGAGTLVIGGRGPEDAALRRLAGDLGVGEHVRFAGYIPRADVAAYFSACDVFAFHSTFETYGLVVAEAMSHARAVVTVRNTALPEVVGDAGLLVPTGDARAMGDALARVLSDGPLRRALGTAGLRRATAEFDWDRIADRYEAILVRAAARGAR